METKTNRELTEQLQSLETYTKTYLPKQLKDTDAKIPDTTSEDVGKFIAVDANGDLAAVEAVNSLPAVTTEQNGSYLRAQNGTWALKAPTTSGTLAVSIGDDDSVTITSHPSATNFKTGSSQYRERINDLSVTLHNVQYTIKVPLQVTQVYSTGDTPVYTNSIVTSPIIPLSDTIKGYFYFYVDAATPANSVYEFIKV